jgi:MoaA/NifB/PqqE/SkfB family radical SAM enzyme
MKFQRIKNDLKFYSSPFKPFLLFKLAGAALVRRPGEIAKTVDISLGSQCNMKCQHCSAETLKSGEPPMTLDDYKALVKHLDRAGTLRVNLTGGEPLLRRDFDAVVTALKPHRRYIKLQTNGVLLDRARIRHLKRLGVNAISISLDSMDANEYAAFRGVRPQSHAKILENIPLVRECGLQISVSFVLTHQNLRSEMVDRVIEYTRNAKITLLANVATASGRWQTRPSYLFDEQDRVYLEDLQRRFPYLRTDHDRGGCPAAVRKVYITPQGDVLPCPFIHVSYGNVRHRPLAEIIAEMTEHYPFSRMPVCPAAEGESFLTEWYPHIGDAPKLPLPVERLIAIQKSTAPRVEAASDAPC